MLYGSVAGQFRHVAVGSSIFVENHGKEERSVCHEKICERLSDLSSRMCGTWRCGMRDRTGIRSRNGRIAAGVSGERLLTGKRKVTCQRRWIVFQVKRSIL